MLDRQKLRLEYLKKKRRANSRLVVVVVSFIGSIYTMWIAGRVFAFPVWLAMLLWVFMVGVYTPATIYNWRFLRKTAKSIPVVLPLTPDMLPAEEVLVRGSQEPSVLQSEILLRAATGFETPTCHHLGRAPAEILVRSSEDPSGAQGRVLLTATRDQEMPTEQLLRGTDTTGP